MDFPERLEVIIEVPRGGFIKRKDDGGVDFVSPFPCPFNYGSVPDTVSGDGDRLDALVLGPSAARGTRVVGRVVGRVRFVDAGLEDPKYICSEGPLGAADRRRIERFFTFYARAKQALNLLRGKRGTTAYRGIELLPP
ncbi:MAG: inorganic diphosphatase [Myxococcales bacterium]